ncbi:LysR family transcriptional regulator, partial [Pseudomonas sp. MWU13-2625]
LEAEMADEAVASMSSEPRGRLRVSSPVGLAQEFMPWVISSFLTAHPLVQLEVLMVNRRVDLVTEGVDVALRVREQGDEDPLLVTRRLRQAQTFILATPAFLEQHPINQLDDLRNAPVLGALEADRLVHLSLINAEGEKRELALEARLGVDDFVVRKACALAGLGFTV